MIKVFAVILLLIQAIALSREEDTTIISDPELDFINNSFIFKNSTHKKEIIRKELDLTGEGQLAIFLRASVGGGRCGQYWTAYLKTGGNSYKRYEDVEFRDDTFRAGNVPAFNPTGGILTYYPGNGAGDLMRITFSSSEAVTHKIRTIVTSNPEDQLVFESIFGRKLSDPIPEEYFRNPSHKVISVAEILARPKVDNYKSDLLKGSDASVDVSRQVANSQHSDKTFESNQVTPQAERNNSPLWLIIVYLIVVVSGIVWWRLKK